VERKKRKRVVVEAKVNLPNPVQPQSNIAEVKGGVAWEQEDKLQPSEQSE
jgi:hypothetical protein